MNSLGLSSISESFECFDKSINGESRSELHRIRRDAITTFGTLGFPKTHMEEWKYTQSRDLADFIYRPSEIAFDEAIITAAVQAERNLFEAEHCIVMVNGRYCPQYSQLPTDTKVHISGLSDAFTSHKSCVQRYYAAQVKTETSGLSSLNTAFMVGGIFLCVEKGTHIPGTVHMISVVSPQHASRAFCPRSLIILGEGSSLSLIESHIGVGDAAYLTNFVGEIVLGAESSMKFIRVVKEADNASHVAHYGVAQGQASTFKLWNFSLSGRLIRQEIAGNLAGNGAYFNVRGLDIGLKDQHIDTCLLANHAHGMGTSIQLVKGVFNDRSTGVFNGRIFVAEGADKTDAIQVNKNLMLSEECQVYTRPQLEIYADDVKCNHGATVGKIDEKALFYLQARGICKQEARKMIAQAFVEEVLDDLVPELMTSLKNTVRERLAHV